MAKKILVVDDSAVIRQVEESVLVTASYDVMTAMGGLDAIAKMETSVFNLILTDLNMPDLDGISLIKRVRASTRHRFTPVGMITTESRDLRKQEGKSAGAAGWIVKPFTPDQLIAVVRQILG
jgi:two-component system, chemotaxis family, chemotaxis protein CheY